VSSGKQSEDSFENQSMRLGVTICNIAKDRKVIPELHLPMLERSTIKYVEIWPSTERGELDVLP